MLELTGKAALVTGGASGIGAAVVEALQKEGVAVASLDWNRGGSADIRIECDVSDEVSLRSSVDAAVTELGRLDYALVNAGVSGRGSIIDMPMEEWDRVMGINLRGAFMTLQACAQKMRDAGNGGSIVMTASLAAILTDIGMVHYNVAKAGVAKMAAVAARELGYYGIRVNSVCPGLTNTGMTAGTDRMPGYHDHVSSLTPLGRIGEAADLAEAIMALFAMNWVTGQSVAVDGGLGLSSPTDTPGLTPEKIAREGIIRRLPD
jgi:NAD(P)-dependent dehydrogenase (short-subunit alcohol dehydrogenase family)